MALPSHTSPNLRRLATLKIVPGVKDLEPINLAVRKIHPGLYTFRLSVPLKMANKAGDVKAYQRLPANIVTNIDAVSS